MSSEPAKPTQKNAASRNNRTRNLAILSGILILIIIALLIWFIPMTSNYKALVEEKETQRTELQDELNNLMARHDSIKAEYGALSDSLKVKDSIIRSNAKEIQSLLNYKWEYYKVDKKLDLLRNITQGYVHQLDSLYTVNRELKEENERITQQFVAEQQKTTRLSEEKDELVEKMDNAAILNIYNLTAEGIRLTGSGRERPTDKARKIEQVKVCFMVGENKLIEPGPKTIYLRIARPDNVIVSQRMGDVYTFEHEGEKIEYTTKKEIDYQGEPMNLCMYWSKKSEEPAMEGTYNVAVFAGGIEIGQTAFELR